MALARPLLICPRSASACPRIQGPGDSGTGDWGGTGGTLPKLCLFPQKIRGSLPPSLGSSGFP